MTDLNFLILFWISSFLFSGSLTYFSYQTYRDTRSTAIQWVMLGFGLVTLAFILGPIASLAVGLDLHTSVLFQSVILSAGLAFLLYSLFVKADLDEE